MKRQLTFGPRSELWYRHSTIQYAGLLGYWDKWLVNQVSYVQALFFFIISYRLRVFLFVNLLKRYIEAIFAKNFVRNREKNQTFGWRVICPREPAHYFVDCRISYLWAPKRALIQTLHWCFLFQCPQPFETARLWHTRLILLWTRAFVLSQLTMAILGGFVPKISETNFNFRYQ